MGKFTGGLVAGSAIGALGLAIALSDKRTKRKMLRDGKRAVHKVNRFFHNM
jgi:hypothetical protein